MSVGVIADRRVNDLWDAARQVAFSEISEKEEQLGAVLVDLQDLAFLQYEVRRIEAHLAPDPLRVPAPPKRPRTNG